MRYYGNKTQDTSLQQTYSIIGTCVSCYDFDYDISRTSRLLLLGIVPRFCEKIFNQIDEKKAAGEATEYQVIFSMLEIYNEEVRDLLVDQNPRGGMKVRENPKTGFYGMLLRKFS